MTKVDATHWSLTVTSTPAATLQDKYTLGSWGTAEQTSSCGHVNNRTFVFRSAGTSYPANDTVAAWQGIGGC